MLIKRIFGVTAPPFFSSTTAAANRVPIEVIREHLTALLHDCTDTSAQRIIYRINAASTPADLWLLRSDLLQCIARARNQSEAVDRINSVISVFEGWVPDSQLATI